MISRTLKSQILKASREYPIVAILGPRQSGKTTLAKHCFPKKAYVSLENPETRLFAEKDPKGFFNQFQHGVILDEIQKVPELFSYLQVLSDEKKQNGFYVITGSQNYLLMEKISQSLAGRVALHTLLSFSQEELGSHLQPTLYENIWKGGYPRIYDAALNPTQWCENYVQTYVERDVRSLKNIGDLTSFTKFVKMCANRSGQLLNLSSLGDDCGINHNTAKSWLTILETSYILFLLRPYHQNFNKRLVKSPKLYFYDTGLLCYLMGIHTADQIPTHAFKGSLFENYILSEIIKRKLNSKSHYEIYFWQDSNRHEIDCLIENGEKLIPIEIKSGETFAQDYLKNFKFWKALSTKKQNLYLIYAGSDSVKRQNVQLLSWRDIQKIKIE